MELEGVLRLQTCLQEPIVTLELVWSKNIQSHLRYHDFEKVLIFCCWKIVDFRWPRSDNDMFNIEKYIKKSILFFLFFQFLGENRLCFLKIHDLIFFDDFSDVIAIWSWFWAKVAKMHVFGKFSEAIAIFYWFLYPPHQI